MDFFKTFQSNKQAQTSAFDSFRNKLLGGNTTTTSQTANNTPTQNQPITTPAPTVSTTPYGPAKPTDLKPTTQAPTVKSETLGTTSFQQTPPPPAGITNYGTSPVATPEPIKKEKSARELLQEKILASAETNTADEKARIRQEQDTAGKLKRANALAQEYDAETLKLQERVDRLEKNPQGVFGGALDKQIRTLTYEGNKNLAILALRQRIANDDYQGAEKIVSERLADIKADRDYQLNAWKTAYDFIQNDMTESEKMQAQQAFELNKIDYENQIEGEKALLESAKLDEEATKLAEGYRSGFITEETLNKQSDKVKSAVWAKLVQNDVVSPAQLDQINTTKKNLANIDALLTGGTSLAVGSGATRVAGEVLGFFGITDTKNVQATIDNLETNLAKEVLPLMKGPTSDRDIEFIKSAAAKLQKSQSPEQFQVNLLELRRSVKDGLINSVIVPRTDKEILLEEHMILENSLLPANERQTPEELSQVVDILMDSIPVYGADSPVSSIQIPPQSRLAYVNNNPGNLRYAQQDGAVPGEGGFAKFNSPEEGYTALKKQIALDKSRNLTVQSFISKYAPPTENDTNEYVAFVSNKLGVPANTNIKDLSTDELAKVVAQKESSTIIS